MRVGSRDTRLITGLRAQVNSGRSDWRALIERDYLDSDEPCYVLQEKKMRERHADRLKLRFAIATLIAISFSVSALANAGPQRPARSQTRISRPRLVELRSIDQLKELFQRDTGKVRLVALVSPT
jgi:hypothetical protein